MEYELNSLLGASHCGHSKNTGPETHEKMLWTQMWDNIGFAFRLVATCVRLVVSDRRVTE